MNEELYTQLDDFHHKRMEPPALAAFEARMGEDESLRQAYADYLKDRRTIEAAARGELSSQASLMLEKSQIRRINVRRMQIAAAIVVLVVFGGIWWQSGNTIPPTELYAEYYEAPVPSASRNSSGDIQEAWNYANSAFADKEYDTAIAYYLRLSEVQDFEYKDESLLMAGVTLLEIGRYTDAASVLEIYNKDSALAPDTQWYLAMAYLGSEQSEKAKGVLEAIVERDGFKKAEAKAILRKL